MEEKAKMDNRSRMREIRGVLFRNHITRGVTPEKLRVILEELGPTYIKLGQIMSLHSDILPKAYCEELMKLTSDVAPMPFSEVEEVINRSYREDWRKVFSLIEENPLGSASIAQVHRAKLLSGEEVVVKVQRKGIYDTMARDIGLLHRLVHLMPSVGGIKNVVDLGMVLDEMWAVAQEEMDFLKEAANIEEFARNNEGINYIRIPRLYREHTTSRVLVMEYVGGFAIDDREGLLADGYDLEEVGRKLVNNYIKQVMEDGFFHADPHPGNVKVHDGKIVWIDMGMMGRLSARDRTLMERGVRAIALSDIAGLESTILELCHPKKKVDDGRLYSELRTLIDRYGKMSLGNIDIVEFLMEILEIMKENGLRLPHGMTMLARGMNHMQGVLAEISPEINMMEIAAGRIRENAFENFNPGEELRKGGKKLYTAAYKAVEIPPLLKSVLEEYLKGQAKVKMELDATREMEHLLRRLIRNIVMGLWVMALLISSSIICTTDMHPRLLGIPALGFFGYILAFAICLYIFIRHWFTRNK
ncbi:MAG: AarF/UbiB family protein [Eubacteriales bacterium]|nr:AarF/UbiB family protein [Eubacteriales bacterium]